MFVWAKWLSGSRIAIHNLFVRCRHRFAVLSSALIERLLRRDNTLRKISSFFEDLVTFVVKY